MWTPDIVLFNSADNDKLHLNKMQTDIRVNNKGVAWWSSPMVVTTRLETWGILKKLSRFEKKVQK